MKLIKCTRHKNTFLASDETLLTILAALFTDPEIDIYKIQRCECRGWHIFVDIKKFKKLSKKKKLKK